MTKFAYPVSNWNCAVELDSIDFSGLSLTNCNFSTKPVSGCNFVGTTLTGCTFGPIEIASCDFTGATLVDCNFEDASFKDVKFQNAVVDDKTTVPDFYAFYQHANDATKSFLVGPFMDLRNMDFRGKILRNVLFT